LKFVLRYSALTALLLSAGATSWAQPAQVNFTARVTQAFDPENSLRGSIQVGDILEGSYTYDASFHAFPADPFHLDSASVTPGAYYYLLAPPYGISVRKDQVVFETDPARPNTVINPRILDFPGWPLQGSFRVSTESGRSSLPDVHVTGIHLSIGGMNPSTWLPDGEALTVTPPTFVYGTNWGFVTVFGSPRVPHLSRKYFAIEAKLLSVEAAPTPSFAPFIDSDEDAVPDDADLCPGTVIPESNIPAALKRDHYVVSMGKPYFIRGWEGLASLHSSEWRATMELPVTLAETGGCTCEQILLQKAPTSDGQCARGVIDGFAQ
jgi:hypothetical protein